MVLNEAQVRNLKAAFGGLEFEEDSIIAELAFVEGIKPEIASLWFGDGPSIPSVRVLSESGVFNGTPLAGYPVDLLENLQEIWYDAPFVSDEELSGAEWEEAGYEDMLTRLSRWIADNPEIQAPPPSRGRSLG